jgi:hypothetical protein
MPPRRVLLAGALALPGAAAAAGLRARRGFNLVTMPQAPLGSAAAAASFAGMAALGADTVALVCFLWQATPGSPAIVRGSDLGDAELAAGIAQAQAAGLSVMVKPHVWLPGSWAGEVAPPDEAGWREWFAGYQAALLPLARLAQAAGAAAFCLGTELRKTSMRAEWGGVIAALRGAFRGTLLYTAHNADEAGQVAFWGGLDVIGVSLYPALGADDAPLAWQAAMAAEALRIDVLAARHDRPVWVTEIGIRSAIGAAAKPWESAEERVAAPDGGLQAAVLARWLAVLDRPAVAGVLVWRWFSDPAAGGPADTDFTVQGKPAEAALRAHWR